MTIGKVGLLLVGALIALGASLASPALTWQEWLFLAAAGILFALGNV